MAISRNKPGVIIKKGRGREATQKYKKQKLCNSKHSRSSTVLYFYEKWTAAAASLWVIRRSRRRTGR